MLNETSLMKAYNSRDIIEFLQLFFPDNWSSISARIVESGATISDEMCPWAPRWSPVPPTIRQGKTEIETALKSCLYRAHDCIHQLWGLPMPGATLSEEDFYIYKRAQMCGEIAVLTLCEFALASELYQNEWLKIFLIKRNALPMLHGPLKGKSYEQIAARLDELLHKKIRPKWVREHKESIAFVDDYVPMLEFDRRAIDHNWNIMKNTGWLPPIDAPNARYSQTLTGLELTMWMIYDFNHLLDTDNRIDMALAEFNKERRKNIILPSGWNETN